MIVYAIFAKKGDNDAQFNLGYCYENGLKGLDIDLKEAAKWYQKAAKKGHSSVQNSLGSFFMKKGLGD